MRRSVQREQPEASMQARAAGHPMTGQRALPVPQSWGRPTMMGRPARSRTAPVVPRVVRLRVVIPSRWRRGRGPGRPAAPRPTMARPEATTRPQARPAQTRLGVTPRSARVALQPVAAEARPSAREAAAREGWREAARSRPGRERAHPRPGRAQVVRKRTAAPEVAHRPAAAAAAALTRVVPAVRRPTLGRSAGRRRALHPRAHPTPVRVRALPRRARQLPVLRAASRRATPRWPGLPWSALMPIGPSSAMLLAGRLLSARPGLGRELPPAAPTSWPRRRSRDPKVSAGARTAGSEARPSCGSGAGA
jgi:hypothetical protein